MYDHMKGYLVSLCQAELEASHVVQDTFNFLLEKSSGVSGIHLHTCLGKTHRQRHGLMGAVGNLIRH